MASRLRATISVVVLPLPGCCDMAFPHRFHSSHPPCPLQAQQLGARSSAARSALLQLVHVAAGALRLPDLAASVHQAWTKEECAQGRQGVPVSGSAAAGAQDVPAAPAVQQPTGQEGAQQVSRPQVPLQLPPPPVASASEAAEEYTTPPGSVAASDSSSTTSSNDSRSSSAASSPRSGASSGGEGEITARFGGSLPGQPAAGKVQPPTLRLGTLPRAAEAWPGDSGVGPAHAHAKGDSSARRLSGLTLSSLPMPHAVSPQVLARLHSIKAKLATALADQELQLSD